MANERRIPQTLSGFDLYIRRAVPYVDPGAPMKNGVRLGMTSGEITTAKDYLDSWYTGNPATPGIYEKHSNPDTKTKTTRNGVVTVMKNFSEFFGPLLTRMGTSGDITESDRSNLGLPAPDRIPTTRGAIEDAPVVGIASLAGAMLKIRSRIAADASRASMHQLADGVEMRYQIGGTAPANALACTGTVISKKALFKFDAGVDNDGKKIYAFLRYVNQSNPEHSGPWSSIQTGTVQA
ncbi:MAG: hypothetical protein JJE25_03935 [Bacteroidia bacterium]|nr:hypothetical protein [Bacteroidia bacterium]